MYVCVLYTYVGSNYNCRASSPSEHIYISSTLTQFADEHRSPRLFKRASSDNQQQTQCCPTPRDGRDGLTGPQGPQGLAGTPDTPGTPGRDGL